MLTDIWEALNPFIFHWVPEKAVNIGGQSLLWDARCAGIYIGIGVGLLWHGVIAPTSSLLPSRSVRRLIWAMLLPMVLDLLSIIASLREPSNNVRLATGIVFGGAFIALVYPALASLCVRQGRDVSAFGGMTSLVSFEAVSGVPVVLIWTDATSAFYIVQALAFIGFAGLLVIFGLTFGVAARRSPRAFQRRIGVR